MSIIYICYVCCIFFSCELCCVARMCTCVVAQRYIVHVKYMYIYIYICIIYISSIIVLSHVGYTYLMYLAVCFRKISVLEFLSRNCISWSES